MASGPAGVDGIAADLHHYLQESREALLGALDGLDDYAIRRPMTPSATNLLGLVKHVTGVELSYLGDCVGRVAPVTLPWVEDGSIWDGADMWATADQSRDYLVDLYRSAWAHADASIATVDLAAPAHVAWWGERRDTTFGHLLARVTAETAQHAGHADIVRELLDGRGGRDHGALGDEEWWSEYLDRVQQAADASRPVTR